MPLRPSIPATAGLVFDRWASPSVLHPPVGGSTEELRSTRSPRIRSRASVIAAILVTGCGTPTAPSLPSIQSVDDLRAALVALGSTVETRSTQSSGIFSVPGEDLLVDGTIVSVYVFADEAAAEADVARLEQALILWVAPPRLYRSGPVLALLVGGTWRVRRNLERAMGPPVAPLD